MFAYHLVHRPSQPAVCTNRCAYLLTGPPALAGCLSYCALDRDSLADSVVDSVAGRADALEADKRQVDTNKAISNRWVAAVACGASLLGFILRSSRALLITLIVQTNRTNRIEQTE